MNETVKKYQHLFKWRIENFSFCKQGKGEQLVSATFLAECIEYTNWHLILYPYEWLKPDGFVSGFLCRYGGNGSIRVDFNLQIAVENNCILVSEIFTNVDFQKDDIHGFRVFIKSGKIPDFGISSRDVLTFCCFVSENGLSVSSTVERMLLMKTNVNRHCFEWFVRRLQFNFKPKMFHMTETVMLKVSLDKVGNDIKIKLFSMSNQAVDMFYLECKLFIVDVEGKTRISRRATNLFHSNTTWFFPFSIIIEDLKDIKLTTFTLLLEFTVPVEQVEEIMRLQEQNSQLIYKDNLSLREETKVDSSTNTTEVLVPSNESCCSLQEVFRRMYLDSIKSDVEIRIGDKSYPAHKCVLSARSPVFNAMFEQDMVERQTGVVSITDFEWETVNSFLLFLYTETFENVDYDRAVQLLMIADKYQVSSLKVVSSKFLESVIDLERVCQILEIAERVGEKSLKLACKKFIKTNAAKVFLTSDWLLCIKNNAKVVSEILQELSGVMGATLSNVQ